MKGRLSNIQRIFKFPRHDQFSKIQNVNCKISSLLDTQVSARTVGLICMLNCYVYPLTLLLLQKQGRNFI